MEINEQPPIVPTPVPNQNNGSGNNTPADHALMGVLSYVGVLVIVPILTESRNNPFVKFHIKQGLVLLIAEIVGMILIRLPVLGWFIGPVVWIGALVLAAIGIANVLNKETKELPLIGHLANKINI